MDRRNFLLGSLTGIVGVSDLAAVASGLFKAKRGGGSVLDGSEGRAPAGAATEGVRAITLEFGVQDNEPGRWDGIASISTGEITKIRGYRFSPEDKVNEDGVSWHASTVPWPPSLGTGDLNPHCLPRPQGARLQTVGITIYYRAPESAVLRVKIDGVAFSYPGIEGSSEMPFLKIPMQKFEFLLADVPEMGSLNLLDARVRVFRVPPVDQITGPEYQNDYPSMVVGSNGDIWVAWLGYRNLSEDLWIRRRSNGSWTEPLKVTEKAGDLCSPSLAIDRRGRVWVVWPEHLNSDWHLMARSFDGAWGSVQQLTRGHGNNLFQRLVADRMGNLHLAWQGFRGAASRIFYKSLRGNTWSGELDLSDPMKDPRANDWSPALTVDRSGTAWVAWDSYAKGSYNIVMRPVRRNKARKLIAVTDSPRFHANPTLAVDDRDRLWVAWEEAGENWGKDAGYQFNGGEALYASRQIRVAICEDGRWLEPRTDLNEVVTLEACYYVQSPKLVPDGKGRMWIVFRPRTIAGVQMAPSFSSGATAFAMGGQWEVMTSCYAGDRWLPPVTIPESTGRNAGPFDAVTGEHGEIWLAWNTDHRPSGGRSPWRTMSKTLSNDILVAKVSIQSAAPMELGPRRGAEPPARLLVEPLETSHVARLRNYTVSSGNKTYRIYRGDMHRHTEISPDGAGEGTLWDAYRYALDAANLDYMAITDHMAGGQEYTWWRTEKASDMFHVSGFFTPLFGYERSVGYPTGHRNVIFAHRGVRVLPVSPQENTRGSGPVLYPYLRKNHGICMPHTPVNIVMGTDWAERDNIDSYLEPLVEIFQGARISSEAEGSPLSPSPARLDIQHGEAGGYQPLGWVWQGWQKGYKLGVQCSSDHTSTHCSYACILTEDYSREGLLAAMRKRHAYGATANIIMDFRLQEGGREYIMGDSLSTSSHPLLLVKVFGTAPIRAVRIFRDAQQVFSQPGTGESAVLNYRDATLTSGEHYYYVRMEQEDGNVAWASPIWIKYGNPASE